MTDKIIQRVALTASLLVVLVALSACPQRAPLALKKVVLYQNGIGYFERQGTFTGDKIRLRLRSHELKDVLKSLTVIDRSAGDKPQPVTAVVPKQPPATPPKDGAKAPADAEADRPVYLDISLSHAGRHDLLIAYSVPTPTWKATYRLVLPDKAASGDRTLIQGWALVNNASGEDWSKIRLTLATGAPMTFAMDMRTPQFIARPDLTGRLVKPVTTGVVTSESARPGDQDGDGVGDAVDLCPKQPEDRDGFEDKDGCPDPDNDKDRITDVSDKCPNEPETYNGFSDDDGCPDKGRIVVHKGRIEILDKIYFSTGSAAIKQVSLPIVGAIAATLLGNPQIKIIEVQGHASSSERDSWSLSAQRAGAVRAWLKRKGVSSEVRARAYGATRKVDNRNTEEAHSRNRRVEFLIIKRTDGSDDEGQQRPAPGPVTADAAHSSVHSGAKLTTVAGMVRYELPGRVSIGQGTTTMVTMINRRTSGQDVYLYRPDSNVPGSDRYPQRAAMLENSSKLTLEPGPVAIFARGTFVGEGLIKRLHPGQTAFIPYAVDSSASVRVHSSNSEKPSTFVSLIDGVCTVENHAEIVTRYKLETGGQTPSQMVVKHPRRAGYELQDLPPGTSTTPTAVLIPFPINPSSTSELTVRERKPVRRTIWIKSGGLSAATRLELYLSASTTLSKAGKKKLRQIIEAQRKAAKLDTKVDRLRASISDIGMRTGELRESLKAVARTRGGAALRAKLLKQLTTSVSQLGQATQKLTAASLELSEARDALKKLIAALRIPADKKADQAKKK
jgi:outer membrane protein OmpA-like peptidoglycan-associated protein